jgi:hypothetical protein
MSNRQNEGFDFAFDLGTSPHGLSVELPLPEQETEGASCDLPSAKPVLPLVFRTAKVRQACRCIRAAFAKQPHEVHHLRLTDREFLNVYQAVEHDRSRMRKAIGKGIADHQDLRATDSLWHILQDVMTRRMRGCRL